MRTEARRAAWALALLVPAPSLGALSAFALAPGLLGQSVYALCKLWILALPMLWYLRVERGRASGSPLRREVRARALGEGALLGALFALVVIAAYGLVGERWIAGQELRELLTEAGVGTPGRYISIALYIALANSLLEEYVWRWFAFRQVERVVGTARAVPLAALCFTFHHAIVFGIQLGPELCLLGSAGVFAGGCLWSLLYSRWRSIWPAWISHVIVDAAGLWIGWRILF